MARYNINTYNQSIDYTRTVQRIGRNGVHYEYIIPKSAPNNLTSYYMDAVDVKSKKSPTTKYRNGKRPGQYQPIGDKSYFTFYQLKKLRRNGADENMIKVITEMLRALYLGE